MSHEGYCAEASDIVGVLQLEIEQNERHELSKGQQAFMRIVSTLLPHVYTLPLDADQPSHSKTDS